MMLSLPLPRMIRKSKIKAKSKRIKGGGCFSFIFYLISFIFNFRMLLLIGGIGMVVVTGAWGELKTWRMGEGGERWSAWVGSVSGIDFEGSPGSIQPRELRPEENLALRLKWKDGKPGDFTVGGEARVWDNTARREPILVLVDDDSLTSTGDRFKAPRANYTGVSFYFDFGESFAIGRMVFYPRQTGEDEEGRPHREDFLQGFEVFVSDGHTFTPGGQPEYTLLTSRRRNRESVVDLPFGLRTVRFVKLRSTVPYRFEIAEVEFYGSGFSTETEYLSEVIDLGEKANFGEVSWEVSKWRRVGEALEEAPDADVSVVVEGRSGLDATPKMYFMKGDTVEVTEEEYLELKVEERGSVKEDYTHWSLWFPLTAGGTFPTLGPRRYFQFRISLYGTRIEMIRVSSFSVGYAVPLLAEDVTGEIALQDEPKPPRGIAEVEPGKEEIFTCDVRAKFISASQGGFDGLKIEVPARPKFEGFEVGGISVVPDSIYVTPESPYVLEIFFPSHRITMGHNLPLRVTFRAAILTYGAEFRGYVSDTRRAALSQLVEPGDANPEVETNTLKVLLLKKAAGKILSSFGVSPAVITPNGDGMNEEAVLSYIITQMLGEAKVKLGMYDMMGRLVREFPTRQQGNGFHEERWDGQDEEGQLVDPGLYLCKISVKTDRETFEETRSVVVVY